MCIIGRTPQDRGTTGGGRDTGSGGGSNASNLGPSRLRTRPCLCLPGTPRHRRQAWRRSSVPERRPAGQQPRRRSRRQLPGEWGPAAVEQPLRTSCNGTNVSRALPRKKPFAQSGQRATLIGGRWPSGDTDSAQSSRGRTREASRCASVEAQKSLPFLLISGRHHHIFATHLLCDFHRRIVLPQPPFPISLSCSRLCSNLPPRLTVYNCSRDAACSRCAGTAGRKR